MYIRITGLLVLVGMSLHGMEHKAQQTQDDFDLFLQKHMYLLPQEKEKESEFQTGLERLGELYEKDAARMPLLSDDDKSKLTKYLRKEIERKKEKARQVIGTDEQFESLNSLAKKRGNKPEDDHVSRMVYFAPKKYYWVKDWEGAHALYGKVYKDNIPCKAKEAATIWRAQNRGTYSFGQVHLNNKDRLFCYISQTMLEVYGNQVGIIEKDDYQGNDSQQDSDDEETKEIADYQPEIKETYKEIQVARLITNYKKRTLCDAMKKHNVATPDLIKKLVEYQQIDDQLYEYSQKLQNFTSH